MAAAFKEVYDKTKVFDPRNPGGATPPVRIQAPVPTNLGREFSTLTTTNGAPTPVANIKYLNDMAATAGTPAVAVTPRTPAQAAPPTTIANTTAPPVVGEAPPATTIPGVKEFSFNKALRPGGAVANNSRSDWSDGGRNAMANMAGKSYAEQVAQADKVNAANALGALSPKEAAEAGIMKAQELLATSKSRSVRKGFNATAFANAAGGVAGAQDRMSRAKTLFDADQNTKLASMKDATEKYKVDQDATSRRDVAELNRAGNLETTQAQLEAQKYIADATARNALEAAAAARQQKNAELLVAAANYNPENDLAFQAIADPAARQKYLDEMGYNRVARASEVLRNSGKLQTPVPKK